MTVLARRSDWSCEPTDPPAAVAVATNRAVVVAFGIAVFQTSTPLVSRTADLLEPATGSRDAAA
jgi:hypothetical protein